MKVPVLGTYIGFPPVHLPFNHFNSANLGYFLIYYWGLGVVCDPWTSLPSTYLEGSLSPCKSTRGYDFFSCLEIDAISKQGS